MLILIWLALWLHLSYGAQGQSANFNFRHYCTSWHIGGKSQVSCDGSKHFKDKNLNLDGRNIFGISKYEFLSFDSIHINAQNESDWDGIEKITIRNCDNVKISFQSLLRLNELEIDTVNELTVETKRPEYRMYAELILLTNIRKITWSHSNDAMIMVKQLTFNNIDDVNLMGVLTFSGHKLTISESNIDVVEQSTLIFGFYSISIQESTKLYIQGSGQLNVSSDSIIIKESYIYMDGQVNMTSNEYSGEDTKVIKFLTNSIYGKKKGNFHIYGSSVVTFNGNDIYNSDIIDMLAESEFASVTFSKNHFGCNTCERPQFLQTEYMELIGKQNFCDVSCNLTLARYKTLLDQGKICHQDDSSVDEETLCSNFSTQINITNITSEVDNFWWISIVLIAVSAVLLSALLVFCYKKHSIRVPVGRRIVLPQELKDIEERNKNTVIAFNNKIYERVDGNPENVYEVVD